MPIRLTPLVNGYYYHIFNRGVNKQPIFSNKYDYKRAVNLLRFYNFKDHPIRFSKFSLLPVDERKNIWGRLISSSTYTDIISYCFMPNHFHLLVRQNFDKGISKLLADFQNSYTKYYNLKNERSGHLFQGQFKAVKINSEEQLLHVSRYIHLNPYSSAVVADLTNLFKYKWSSLMEYKETVLFEMCEKETILNNFKSRSNYIDFISDNGDYQKSLETIKHLLYE